MSRCEIHSAAREMRIGSDGHPDSCVMGDGSDSANVEGAHVASWSRDQTGNEGSGHIYGNEDRVPRCVCTVQCVQQPARQFVSTARLSQSAMHALVPNIKCML